MTNREVWFSKTRFLPRRPPFIRWPPFLFCAQGNNQAKVIGMLGVPHAPRGAEYQYLLKVRKWPVSAQQGRRIGGFSV